MEQLNSLAKRVHRAIEQHDLKAAEDASVELAELLDGYATAYRQAVLIRGE
ncbi:MAG: hypothetical protein JO318_05025 [Chloroflexi bacterium]|nr:hypothetical protein [Chloroflexota bacterium]